MLFANQIEDKIRERTYVVSMLSRLGAVLQRAWRKVLAPSIQPRPSLERGEPRNRTLDRILRHRAKSILKRVRQTLSVPSPGAPESVEEMMFRVDFFLDAAAESEIA